MVFYLICIGMGLFASLFYWGVKNKPKFKNHNVILIILILVSIMEVAGYYTSRRSINNSLLYNIGWVYVESLLLIFYFYSFQLTQREKKLIRWVTILFFSWGLFNSIFYQNIIFTFQYFSFLPFAIFIVFLSMYFLYKVLTLKMYADRNLLEVPHFWIVTTILFFYIEAIVLFGTYQFYPEIVVANVKLLFGFNRFIASLMYLSFGFSFLVPLIKFQYQSRSIS